MIYTAPFYAVGKALYSVLGSNASIGIPFFDASVPIEEIEASFKNQAEFAYGIFGSATAEAFANKDTAIWDSSLTVEIYSNYKGRKVIYEKLQALLNYLSSTAGIEAMQAVLAAQGFALVSINVGALNVGLPMYGETGIWQSGSTIIKLRVQQV